VAELRRDLARAKRRNQYHLRQIALLRVQVRGWKDLEAGTQRQKAELNESRNDWKRRAEASRLE
jgi:hypothetical protein